MAQIVCFQDEVLTGSAQRDLEIEDEFMGDLHGVGIGSDHTLCGLAYGEYVSKNRISKITCGGCIQAITFHKSFKKGKDY